MTRGDEHEARANFEKWKGGDELYSDDGDSMGDYDDSESTISSRGRRSYSRRRLIRRSRGHSHRRLNSQRRSNSRRKSKNRRRSNSRRRSKSRRSRSSSRSTFDPDEEDGRMEEDCNSVDRDAGGAQASQPIDVELSIQLSQQSIGADNHISK